MRGVACSKLEEEACTEDGGCNIQNILHQFTAAGITNKLPEETQWSIKALLARAAPAPAPSPVVPSYPGLPQLLLHLVQNMSKVRTLRPSTRATPEHLRSFAISLQPSQHDI
jgi:hypothetical protein